MAEVSGGASEPHGTAAYKPLTIGSAEALRGHLDALNEAGVHPIVVGIDACPQPFLITLVGPYAESEDVFFDSPWQGDVDYGERVDGVWVPKQPRCEDCRAVSHGIEDLRFPVTVLARPGPCSCGGKRWVEDENWQGEYLGPGAQPQRDFWDGLIPCGFCNPDGGLPPSDFDAKVPTDAR